jgi:RNA polymerase sigma-70 factor (ECF subfamily)
MDETRDAELLDRSRSGDAEAFAELLARHREGAVRAASFVLGSHDVDDVLQEAFLRAWLHLDALRDDDAIRPWLLRTVANQARNELRAASRRRAQTGLALAGRALVANEAEPDKESFDRGDRRLAAEALKTLARADRDVITYRYFLGWSEAQTAEAMGCPPGTVKSRLSRALARLRERAQSMTLQEVGSVPDDTAVVERAWEALKTGDLGAVVAEDASWYVGGRSPLAGAHQGREAVVGFIARLHELSGGTFTTAGEDIASTEHHTFVTYLATASREGRTLESHETVVVHLKDGKLGDCFHYFFNQYGFDAFWS